MKKRKRKLKKKAIVLLTIFLIIFLPFVYLLVGFFTISSFLPKELVVNVGDTMEDEINAKAYGLNINLKRATNVTDTSVLGEYDEKYDYKYLFFDKTQDIKVSVVDNEPPEFVKFPDKVELYLDDKYNDDDYPYELKDNYDSTSDIEVKYTGEVDTSKTGEYYLVYTAKDTSGNKTEQVRKVVVEKESPLSLSVKDFDLTKYFDDIILKETGDMGSNYMNNLIFAGDSVYWNMARFDIYDKSKIWAKPCTGPGNIYSQKVVVGGKQSSYTIPELIHKNKPKYLVVNLGGCECQYAKVENFVEEYRKFLVDMQTNEKDTQIIVQTLNPVIELKATPYINNAVRNEFNYYVAKLCRELDIPIIEMNNLFKDKKTGKCKSDLCMSDGYHPNKKGMRMIVDYVRTHGYK